MSDFVRRYDQTEFNRHDRRHLFPLLEKMEQDLMCSGTISLEIVRTVLFCIASFLCQGVANVAWSHRRKLSLGICGIVVARTGTGKSLIQGILMEVIERYLSIRMKDDSLPDPFTEDATREALLKCLREWLLLGLFTDEGAQIEKLFKSGASTIVKLADNSSFRAARVSTGRMALLSYKFCTMLQIQPDLFESLKRHLGTGSKGLGLGNRFVFAFAPPNTSTGTRSEVYLSADVEQAYEKKVADLLGASIHNAENNFEDIPTLQLSAEAQEFLVQLELDTRQGCAQGQPWFHIAEYLTRHIERVLRFAGVLHVFEHGPMGEISLAMLQRAEVLSDWYVNSFERGMFVPPEPPKPTQVEIDADDLERLLWGLVAERYAHFFEKKYVRKYVFNFGLTPARFTRALALLCKQRKTYVQEFRGDEIIQVCVHQLVRY